MGARKLPKESSRIQGIQESPESPGKGSLKASGRWVSESHRLDLARSTSRHREWMRSSIAPADEFVGVWIPACNIARRAFLLFLLLDSDEFVGVWIPERPGFPTANDHNRTTSGPRLLMSQWPSFTGAQCRS